MDERLTAVEMALGPLQELVEDSDLWDARKALEVVDALTKLKAQVDLALAMAQTQAVKVLEQPAQFGGRIFYRREVGKWRPDFRHVAAEVETWSLVDHHTGELLDAERAARQAVQAMRALYVAPATVPKEAGLEKLGLTRRDVCEWERTGWKIESKNVEVPE
jgi:hypothetical protein